MQQYVIGDNEAGQRFDKYLKKILKEAPDSFIYKMLRKKNIVLNGKKCTGNEKLEKQDIVKIFLADETFEKFSGQNVHTNSEALPKLSEELIHQYQKAYQTIKNISIIYEDENILILDKPAGILSQKAAPSDLSLNEWLLGYLLEKDVVSATSLSTFKPSICNRLDRNTSGMVVCSKSLAGSQYMSRIIKEKTLEKYYHCIVPGSVTLHERLTGYLYKDKTSNKVTIYKTLDEIPAKQKEKAEFIDTEFHTLQSDKKHSLIEVQIYTGKTHQIRAHLASIGHPIIGDCKYGFVDKNQQYSSIGVHYQLLHAYKLVFPYIEEERFKNISGLILTCKEPELFKKVLTLHNGDTK
ncbi:MAG: RluA family pseudouridine synthase [Lachnospiraceae bacterium]|nr:RluA family pseudouridine synthase [Lachnospiraceae bacterium]